MNRNEKEFLAEDVELNDGRLLKLSKGKVWYIMIILYFLWFLDYATRMVISPMYPVLQKEFGLTDSQLGLLTTIVLAMIALFSVPVSYFVDRWRRGKLISLMAIIWSISTFFSGLSNNFTQLLITRGILGVGESSYASGGMAMISAIIKKPHRATVTGLWNTAIPFGLAFGLLIGGWVTVNVGWRQAFMVVAIPGIVLGILAWFIPDYKNKSRNNEIGSAPGKTFWVTFKDLLKNKTLISLYTSFGILNLFLMSMIYWQVTYFVRYMGMSVGMAGTMNAAMAILALIGGPLGGVISDRIALKNPAYKMVLCYIVAALSVIFYATGVFTNQIPFFFAGAFFSFMLMAPQMTATQEIVPSYERGSSYGIYVISQYVLGGLWGPWLTGVFSDVLNLQTACLIMSAIAFIGSLGYLLAAKFFNHDIKAAKEKDRLIAVEPV
jgi:MFS family permease